MFNQLFRDSINKLEVMILFSQKLDFIMNLTNSRNTDLARAIGVDTSAISRLRSGKRRLPKVHDFLPHMCSYFALGLNDECKKRAAAEAVCPGKEWPEDMTQAAELISCWLKRDGEEELCSVENLLYSVSKLAFPKTDYTGLPERAMSDFPPQKLYYGIEGIRQAVLDAFDLALFSGKKRKIYITSDEDAHWLTRDEQFKEQWSMRLKRLFMIGCETKIILNTSRPLGDLLSSMAEWLPLYMTGAVEPYYHQKMRDGVFHRTLFIIEGLCAIEASSVTGLDEGTLSHLLTVPQGVAALTKEFFDYFRLCAPMIKTIIDGETYFRKILEQYDPNASCCFGGVSPSLYTMPLNIVERISYRSGSDRLIEVFRCMEEIDSGRSSTKQLCELISMPTDEQIEKNEIPVGICAPLGINGCFYTAGEYAEHIKSVCIHARENRSYRFALTRALPQNTLVRCRLGEWAAISKISRPCISFICEQKASVKALGDYMLRLCSCAHEAFSLKNDLDELMRKLK